MECIRVSDIVSVVLTGRIALPAVLFFLSNMKEPAHAPNRASDANVISITFRNYHFLWVTLLELPIARRYLA